MSQSPVSALPLQHAAALNQAASPSVVVDQRRVEGNVAAMSRLALEAGVRLRPHAKTHKSVALGKLQMAQGAYGLTVAKTGEAEVFLAGGIPSVTIAQPIVDPAKAERALLAAQATGAEVRFIADSETGIEALAEAGRRAGKACRAYLKVDVGLHRCGVDPQSHQALTLARRLAGNRFLAFSGLLSHAGHAYRLSDGVGVREIATTERQLMTGLAWKLRTEGIDVPEVSVGSTPTVLRNDGFDGITEIRPGNYVYMDRIQVSLGIASLAEVALWVVATVISANDRFAIIDAGSKVLSSDRAPHGSTSIDGYGLAWRLDSPDLEPLTITGLSEEHGFVALEGRTIPIGSRLLILPNHSCSVVNLASKILAIGTDGIPQPCAVDARGMVV